MGFRDAKVGDGLEHQLKMAEGNTYNLKIMNDVYETWDECWPTFPSGDGTVRRRFVGDSKSKNSNLRPIIQYKKEVGVPDGLTERDQGNWKISPRQATVVAVGTETAVKITAEMAKKNPELKKLVGKSRRKVEFNFDEPKALIFGIDILRQLKNINEDPDNKDKMEEKGVDTDKYLPTDCFSIKVTKEKNKQRITYDVKLGKWTGLRDDSDNDAFKKVMKELEGYLKPSDESEVDSFLAEQGEETSGGGEEAESVEETEDDVDVPDVDVEDEEPKKGKGKGKKKEPEPEPEVEEEAEAEDETPDVEDESDGDSEDSGDGDDDLNLDDIDDLLG